MRKPATNKMEFYTESKLTQNTKNSNGNVPSRQTRNVVAVVWPYIKNLT